MTSQRQTQRLRCAASFLTWSSCRRSKDRLDLPESCRKCAMAVENEVVQIQTPPIPTVGKIIVL